MEESITALGFFLGLIVFGIGIAITMNSYKGNNKKPETIIFGIILSIAAAAIAAILAQIFIILALIIIVIWAIS